MLHCSIHISIIIIVENSCAVSYFVGKHLETDTINKKKERRKKERKKEERKKERKEMHR